MLKPAGLDISKGIITAQYLKNATDPQWANDADFKEWKAWMAKYIPAGNLADSGYVYAYAVSSTLHDSSINLRLVRNSGQAYKKTNAPFTLATSIMVSRSENAARGR